MGDSDYSKTLRDKDRERKKTKQEKDGYMPLPIKTDGKCLCPAHATRTASSFISEEIGTIGPEISRAFQLPFFSCKFEEKNVSRFQEQLVGNRYGIFYIYLIGQKKRKISKLKWLRSNEEREWRTKTEYILHSAANEGIGTEKIEDVNETIGRRRRRDKSKSEKMLKKEKNFITNMWLIASRTFYAIRVQSWQQLCAFFSSGKWKIEINAAWSFDRKLSWVHTMME